MSLLLCGNAVEHFLLLLLQKKYKGSLPVLGQDDVGDKVGVGKEWSNLLFGETGNPTAYTSDEERQFGVLLCKADKLIDVGADGLHTALHGGDGIALPLQAYTLTVDGSEALIGQPCGTAAVMPCKVAPKYEHLIGFKVGDKVGGKHNN